MKRLQTPLALSFLIGLLGCGEGPNESAARPKAADAATIEPSKQAVAADIEAPADVSEKSESTTEPSQSAVPSQSTATKENEVPAEVAKNKDSEPEFTPQTEPKPESDPILEGVSGGMRDRFSSMQEAYTKAPEDVTAVISYLGALANLGMFHARQGEKEAASLAFRKAEEVLEKATQAELEVEAGLKAFIYYNCACVTSLEGNAEAALALLEKAMESEFSDLNQLQKDEDLVAVRELPGFAEKFAGWEAEAKERAIEHARADLAKAESFPFTFELTDVKGAPIKLADFQGKVCIVDIWGTWCPPCREEIPSFIKLQEAFGSKGFQMVGLNQENAPTPEEEAEKVVNYMEANAINYPCALITEDVMGQVPEFEGFPTTLFIDRQGKVRLKAVGLHEYAYLDAVVSELLAEGTTPAPAEGAAVTPAPADGAAAPVEGAAPESEPATPPVGEAAQENP